MKKRALLKTIMIAIFVYAVLTWIIPAGYFTNGEYKQVDILPVGLFDLVRYPILTITSPFFLHVFVVIGLIGVLYSVLNKTGVYQNFVDGTVKRYKDSKIFFLVLTCLVYMVLSSLTGLSLALMVFVPFSATVLFLLGYGKITAMLATIGSILAGSIASTYGYTVAGYVTYYTKNINDSIWYRLGLFVLILGALLFSVVKSTNKKDKVSADKIMLYEKPETKTKKSAAPMLIIITIGMLITFVCMVNWSEVFKINFFNEAFNNVKTFDLGIGYPLFGNLLGSMNAFGSWSDYELAMMLAIIIVLISLVYKIGMDNFVAAAKKGIRVMLPTAFYVLMANVILVMLYMSTDGATIFATIANTLFGLVEGFNGIIYGMVAFIGSFFFNDFIYLLGSLYDTSLVNYAGDISVVGMLAQTMHGLVQFIAPTGVVLIIGLTYFDIPYTKWLKEAFKFVLLALLAIIIIVTLMVLI